MKNIFKFVVCCFFLFSCKSKKDTLIKNVPTTNRSELSLTEEKIVTDFLDTLLKDNRYKNLPICIIKEGIGKIFSLNIYEYCYIDRNLPVKSSTNKEWILNDQQIKKIKEENKNNNKIYTWKVSDFKTIDITILEVTELQKSIKEGTYANLPKRLLVYLSTPLIINENYAFMSFRSGDSSFGFATIDSYTALLKKSKDGKWEVDSYYYDPNSSW